MNRTELVDEISRLAAEEPGRSQGEPVGEGDTAPDGSVYTARIYYVYKLAIGLVTDEAEKAELLKDFDGFCAIADTTRYDLGCGCGWVAQKCVELGELDIAMDFLSAQLFDLNKEAAGTVLSEENMLLYMMMEIALAERNNGTSRNGRDLFRKYKSVADFKKCYIDIKLFTRRLWLGAPHKAEEIEAILEKYPVSGEMLAVIMKYSCTEDVWCDAFEKMAALLDNRRMQQKKTLRTYRSWLKSRREGLSERCRRMSDIDNGLSVRRLDFKEAGEAEGFDQDKKDPRRLAIIFCTNDAQYEEETIHYLKTLKKPDYIDEIEVLPVWGGKSMASAYNFAMNSTDAAYKLYIHHDTFIFDPEMLCTIMQVFSEHPETGMVGVAGSLDLRSDAKWYKSDTEHIRLNVYQDAIINILVSSSKVKNGLSEEATAMDGILLATQADVRWNEEVFDNWHFYDISQCFEMRKAGYSCRIINGGDFFLLHETTMRKDPHDLYEKYSQVFKKTYNI